MLLASNRDKAAKGALCQRKTSMKTVDTRADSRMIKKLTNRG